MNENIWYGVYPDSKRLDISDQNELIALFKYEKHAIKYATKMWEQFYIIQELHADEVKIIL